MIILKSCDTLNNYPTIRAIRSALSQLLKFNDLILKVNKSRCKQCGVTPHFSTWQNQLKKNIEKRLILTQSKKLFDRSADQK